MDRLIYKRQPDNMYDNREMNEIMFDVPIDLDIYEFRIVCIRLAKALGYSDKSVKDAFGPITDTKTKLDNKILNILQ